MTAVAAGAGAAEEAGRGAGALIDLRGVSRTYDDGPPALDDLTSTPSSSTPANGSTTWACSRPSA